MTSIYRVVLFVKDLNGNATSAESIKNELENLRHPEFVDVLEVDENNMGEWHDDHELNKEMTTELAVKYFPIQHNDIDYNEIYLKKEYSRVKAIMLKGIKDIYHKDMTILELKRQISEYKKLAPIMKLIKEFQEKDNNAPSN